MAPASQGILETSLYVSDPAASARFYERIFGFRVIAAFLPRGCAMEAGDRRVLLLFQKRGSVDTETPHHGDGELHIAFAIAREDLERWESWLAENGLAIEERKEWERGGVSLYFRDPDRHLLEVATPGVWATY